MWLWEDGALGVALPHPVGPTALSWTVRLAARVSSTLPVAALCWLARPCPVLASVSLLQN